MSSVGGMESVHAAITKMNYNSTSYSHIKNPEDIDTVDSIEFRNVDFSYKGTNTNIFSNLNFCLEKNKSYAVVGPSGCGKTTLLDLITLNLIPSSGNILFNGSVWSKKLQNNPQSVKDMLENNVSLSSLGSLEDVADLSVFLASDRSSFVTGSIWTLDGGQVHS